MRSSAYPVLMSACLAAALAAKPTQLVPVVHTSRHRNSQYDKERARRIRELDRAVRAKSKIDVERIAAAEAKERPQGAEAFGSSCALTRT